MKKIILIVMLILAFMCSNVYAASLDIFNTRNKIFDESNKIKTTMFGETKSVLIMMTMWDTCVVAIKQVDAYFYMVRIFETIKPEDVKEIAVVSLVDWLTNMKKTNGINIDSMQQMTSDEALLDAATREHLNNLKAYFKELDNNIDAELKKINETKRP